MCGIFGISLKKGSINSEILKAGNCQMVHRGPDFSNYWISKDKKVGFSHTRLAITDINSHANQPMKLDNGNLEIIFNGEIYNYIELRNALKNKYTFMTMSDTEVLGYAYKEYGRELLSKIEGMFSFAIYDMKKNQIFIARDRIGQKPLVYYENSRGFFFSSELPVLLNTNSSLAKDIDYAALQVYLISNYHHIPAPFTIYKKIKKLAPAHYLIIENGRIIENKQYYQLAKIKNNENSKELIMNTIKKMMPRDVAFASFLSGGNDSTLINWGLRNNWPKRIDAYTFRTKETDIDYHQSIYAAKKLGLHQHIINGNPAQVLDIVEEQIRAYGEPYYHLTSIYADMLLKEVKKDHKVLFSGAGGDEVYYGYDNLRFIMLDLFLRINKYIPSIILKWFIPSKYKFIARSNLQNIKEHYYTDSLNAIACLFNSKYFSRSTNKYFSKINKSIFQYAKITNYIDLSYMMGLFCENSHSLTIQSDLVGMKNSIEIRCPFLERRVIEHGYSLNLFNKIKLSNIREGKETLKKILLELFPRKFVYASKKGFGSEKGIESKLINLHYNKMLQKIKKLSTRKMFNGQELLKFVACRNELIRNFDFVMKLYALEIWFEEFIDAH